MSDHHHERIDVLGSLRRDSAAAADGSLPAGAVPEGASQTVRPARAEDAEAIGAVHAATMAVSLASGLNLEAGSLPPEVSAALSPQGMAQGWRLAIEQPPSPEHRVLVAREVEEVVGFAAIAPAVQEVQAAPAAPVDARDAAELAELPAQDPLPEGPQGTGARSAAQEVMKERAEAAQLLGEASGVEQAGTEDAGAERAGTEQTGTEQAGAPQRRVEIVALEVPKEHGRQGHGSRLMAACVDLAREQGAGVVQTWAVQGEESRARFLDSCGFAPMGLRRESQVGEGRLVEICWEAAI